jgi:hypothetical protein
VRGAEGINPARTEAYITLSPIACGVTSWIGATITINGSQQTLPRKTVLVNAHPDANLIGSLRHMDYVPFSPCTFHDVITYNGIQLTSGNGFGITSAQWQTSTNVTYLGQSSQYLQNASFGAHLRANSVSSLTQRASIQVQLTSACGSAQKTIEYYRGTCNIAPPCMCPPWNCTCDPQEPDPIWPAPKPHPNPVSDVLIVDVDFAVDALKSIASETTEIPDNITYDIRLYDTKGALLRRQHAKNGKIEFDVSKLPEGVYFLYIYDGINPKPSMQQIIVQR